MDKGYGLRRGSYMLLFVIMGISIGCPRIEKYKGYELPDDISVSIWKMESDFCASVFKKQNLTAFEFLSDFMGAKFDKNKLDSAFYPIGRSLIDYPFATQSIYYQKATFGGQYCQDPGRGERKRGEGNWIGESLKNARGYFLLVGFLSTNGQTHRFARTHPILSIL